MPAEPDRQSEGTLAEAGSSEAVAPSLLIDLHSHSRYSDGTSTLEDIEAACERRRIGVSLTDHNEIRGSIRLNDRGHILSIPGIEVGTREGLEFLVYFGDPARLEDFFMRCVEPNLLSRFMVRSKARSLAVIDEARDAGGYVSLAHPFAPGRKSIDFHRRKGPRQEAFITRVLEQVDAIELFNGGIMRRSNQLADEFNVGMDKPVTAGSDSHHVSTLGSCGLRYPALEDPQLPALYRSLAANEATEVVSRQGSHFRTVPIIALKHTMFFVRGRRNGAH
jgi:predicted metal-dependent phosphoesterase TrpH